MTNALGPCISAIRASFSILDSASANIANASTDGYKARKTILVQSAAGVASTASVDPSPGPAYALDARAFEGSNVDLASEIVSLMTARHMFLANAASFKTIAGMGKSLMDTLA